MDASTPGGNKRQLEKYAEDLARVYRSEKEKRKALEEANRKLGEYARDLEINLERVTRFNQILDESLNEIYILLQEDFRFVQANRKARNNLGYNSDEMSRLTLFDLATELNPSSMRERLIDLQDGGREVVRLETLFRRKIGTFYAAELHFHSSRFESAPVFVIIALDITERRRAEAERNRLATALHQIHESVAIMDTNLLIQYVNPAFESLTGYSSDQAYGRCPIFLNGGAKETFSSDLWRGSIMGKAASRRGLLRKKNGDLFETNITLSPIFSEDGLIINHVVVIYDLTRESRLEKQLFQAQKMEALGTLAGGIAHDFNNILFIIMLGIETVRDRLPEGSSSQKILDQIMTAGDRAKDLVQQILAFSRRKDQDYRTIDVIPILKETLKLLRSSLPSTIEIKHHFSASTGKLNADPTQIHQILMNLCTNAGYAMREKGGTLTVALDQYTVDPDFAQMHKIKEGKYLRLAVSDTGCGIKADQLTRVFDPFFTTKPPGEGTGLGLAVLHGIVQNNRGTVTLESKVGAGTTFRLYLPITEEASPKSHARTAGPLPRGDARVLVVDDEPVVLEMIREILEELGYGVSPTNNGEEALALFRAKPQAFDLVLTDLTMPRMTGEELARQLRKIRPGIPIILITGYNREIQDDSREGGFWALLTKPVQIREIATTIHDLLYGNTNS